MIEEHKKRMEELAKQQQKKIDASAKQGQDDLKKLNEISNHLIFNVKQHKKEIDEISRRLERSKKQSQKVN